MGSLGKTSAALFLIWSMPALGAGIDRIDGPIAADDAAAIYGAANVPGASLSIDIANYGYVEEEYFITGEANAYRHVDGGNAILRPDIGYTTRIVIRRPADRRSFSGVLHAEPIHPSRGGTSHWNVNAPYIMGKGDIYVAVGMGDDAPSRRLSQGSEWPVAQSQITRWFDPVRYAPLNWPEEDGIRFQVLAQIVRLLRTDDAMNPLAGWPIDAALLGGWSFTGSVQRTYINEGFHKSERLPDGGPIFDGYLIGISSPLNGGGYLPLNSEEQAAPVGDPRRDLAETGVPVIEFLSEFEVASARQPRTVAPSPLHRVYEIGGTIHSASLLDPTQPRGERPSFAQLIARGYPADQLADNDDACDLPISDVAHGAYARAVLDALREWVVNGTPAPENVQLQWADGQVARDAAGNSIGGVRAAEFDVPLASYGPYGGEGHEACKPAAGRPIFVRTDMDRDDLIRRYGSESEYVRQFDAAVDGLVAGRFLLPDDAAILKNRARSTAEKLFNAP